MTFDEFLVFLEAQDGPTPHGAAMCMSVVDWNAEKTALEEACRELGKRCSKAAKDALASLGSPVP
jgi:hypothetical protein